jgi:uncharacterized protein YigE (DUF2233 family)
MKRIVALITLACLAAFIVAAEADAAEVRSVSFAKDEALVRLTLAFDQLPSYEIRDLTEPVRVEIVMLETKLASGAALAKVVYPLLAVNSFQGKDNLSVSLKLPGVYPYEVAEKENALILTFPLSFTNTLTIPVAHGIDLSIERESNGAAYYESFYTSLPPEVVASRLHLVVAASYGAKTLPLSVMAAKESSLLALNAGYFDAGGTPVSLVVSDGVLAALPVKPTRASLIVDQSGNGFISRSKLEVWLMADGKRVRVDGFNQAPKDGTVIAYSRLFPKSKLRADATYYRLSPEGVAPVGYSQVVQESLEDYILALHLSPEADPFKYSRNVTFNWQLTRGSGEEIAVRLAVDGAPLLVEEGRINITVEKDEAPANIANSVRARTAVGFDRAGNLIWFVAREDDESSVPGLSLQELAERMLRLGACTALNLDGGGSSEIALLGVPLNLPLEKERKLPVCLVMK